MTFCAVSDHTIMITVNDCMRITLCLCKLCTDTTGNYTVRHNYPLGFYCVAFEQIDKK